MGTYAMTGGATGIGAAIKQRLHNDGHEVIVIDILDAEINADLSNCAGRQQAISDLHNIASEGLDGFIACAGVGSHIPDQALIASVNYFGCIEIVEGVKDLVALKQGSIVLISSNSAPMPTNAEFVDTLLSGEEEAARDAAKLLAGQQVYSGSKQAVARWMRRNVVSYAKMNIRINAVAPGYTQTPMTRQIEEDPTYGAAIKEFVASIPLGRPGQPDDIANAVIFLLGHDANFISGSVMFVDGGHDAMLRPEQF